LSFYVPVVKPSVVLVWVLSVELGMIPFRLFAPNPTPCVAFMPPRLPMKLVVS